MRKVIAKLDATVKILAHRCVQSFLAVALLLACHSAASQADFQFVNSIQGMDFGNSKLFDFEGTSIQTHTYKVPISPDILKDAKKQNGLKNKVEPIQLPGFESYDYIYSYARELEAGFQKVTTIFVYEIDSLAAYVAFHGWSIDTTLYRQFLSAQRNNMLTGGLFISHASADSISFLDRKIKLGPACQWMAPRSVQCRHKGQINWSVHSSLLKAKEAAKFQFYFTKNEYPMKVLSEQNVGVIFEGIASSAKKVTWKVKGIKGFLAREMEGSNKLIAYYVAVEIKGQFVHCVLSHWDNDPVFESSGLPPLISEVMALEPQTIKEIED